MPSSARKPPKAPSIVAHHGMNSSVLREPDMRARHAPARASTIQPTSRIAPKPLESKRALGGLRRRVLHFAPQDLAHVRLGQLLPELDDLGHLVAGQVLL